jgi:hypothetical protein
MGMRVNLFNHWFKHKVPIEDHIDRIKDVWLTDRTRYSNFWPWLNDRYDVGQYYNWREERAYLVFHNRDHYLMFLLKL